MDKQKFLKKHFNIVLKDKFKATKSFNMNYFDAIPKKLYKYREFNENNLDAIKGDYIWMSKAKDFIDKFDTTIYFDFNKQIKNIEKVIKNQLPDLIFKELKKELIKKGVKASHFKGMTKDNIIGWYKDYTFKNGRFRKGKLRSYMKNIGLINKQINELEIKINELHSDKSIKKFAKTFIESFENINKNFRDMYYIHAFSTNKEHRFLWETYTNSDSGFCLEYDLSLLNTIGIDKFEKLYQLLPILYQEYEETDLSTLVELSISKQLGTSNKAIENRFIKNILISLLTKHPDYSHEDEWRLIIETELMNSNKFKFPFLSAIYMGTQITSPNKKILIQIAKEKKIKLYQREINPLENKYEFLKVEV